MHNSRKRRRAPGIAAALGLTVTVTAAFTALGPAAAADQTAEARKLPGFTKEKSAWELDYEEAFTEAVDADTAAELSRAMSSYTGLVGTAGAARRVAYSVDKLQDWGLRPKVTSYRVYASVPESIEVTMTEPTRRELDLKEPPYPWHEGFENVVVGYNAYSPAGDVTGDLVYVNYGLPEDYQKLEELGISVKDKIVIVRYGRSFRGVKAKVAEERGAKGVIIYSDPEDDGFRRGKVYPEGPWRPPESIQRGSIQYIFNYPGDPLTPGEPAVPGTSRIDPSEAGNLPRIPTTPISYGEAKHLLKALEGPAVPEEWQGGLRFPYHIGPGPTEANLDLDIDYRKLPVYNVITKIRGTEHPEQKVVVGGHFDSWTYGAADNNSGWVSVLGIANGLAEALQDGWRPDRTIVLAGWGGEEYGLFGSTEWVEQRKAALTENAVAYINMDGTGGKNFGTSAVPALDDLITAVTKVVEDPDHGTVYDNWTAGDDRPEVGRLGSGSDYTAFLDHVGVPSTDVGFSTPGGEYHSAYDDTYQMEHFLDPGYIHHAVASEVSGLLALRLANADTLPLAYSDYAKEVRGYLKDLDKLQRELYGEEKVNLRPAHRATRDWRRATRALENVAAYLTRGDHGSAAEYAEVNAAVMAQERDLTQQVGLPDRPWYKHMVYAPGLYTGYAAQFLPALETAIENGDFATAREYRDLLVDSLRAAEEDAIGGIRAARAG